jgi:hypothetical protein
MPWRLRHRGRARQRDMNAACHPLPHKRAKVELSCQARYGQAFLAAIGLMPDERATMETLLAVLDGLTIKEWRGQL